MNTTSTANGTPLNDRAGGEPPYRSAPANIEIELALLGAVLVNNRTYEKVSEFLLPEHFADAAHARIYETCGKLIQRGQQASPAHLPRYFEHDAGHAHVGGAATLVELAANSFHFLPTADTAPTTHSLSHTP